MSWSYRKSFGSGPFRINFSKRGISYSLGIKGARINAGPKGTYVNLSSHGISYRRKISGGAAPGHYPDSPYTPVFTEQGHIASADIGQLTDTDSKDFINELTQKAGQVSYTKWFGFLPFCFFLAIMLFSSFGTKTVLIAPATDSVLARITSNIGVNIRKKADPHSPILKAAVAGQTFQLVDSTNRKWFKVSFNDSLGYISRQFAEVTHVHHDIVNEEETYLSNPYAAYILAFGLIGFIFLIIKLKKIDKARFEMQLQYDMDDQFQQVYQQFGNHFANFTRSARIWQYLDAQRTLDYKRNGGAGSLIKRTSVRSVSANQTPLPHFVTNVAIPHLRLSNIEFYFLPERLLVKRGSTFAAVFYKNLNIDGYTSRFIEDESVPGDAKIVDYTWRYVNKSGGPDRRFNNNRRIPVCAYSQYTLTSDTGIYEVLTTSKQGAMDAFANFLLQIGQLQTRMTIN